MPHPVIQTSRDGAIATVLIDRAAKRNCLSLPMGYAVTAEILIEGRVFTGEEALAKGLLSRLVPDGAVQAEAQALAARIATGSPLSARFHKRALRQLRGEVPLTAADREAEGAFAYTEDFRNAARAFLDKRKPVFEGR